MPVINVFTNQVASGTFNLLGKDGQPIAVGDSIQLDLAGALGGASVVTQIRHANSSITAWISLADGTWTPADDPAYPGSDGSVLFFKNHFMRFVISGATGGTSLSLSVVY